MEPEIIKYIESVDEPRREVFKKILNLIEESIPEGFELTMQNGMPSFVVPLSRSHKVITALQTPHYLLLV